MRELRALSLKVHRNRGAIEMPDVIGARDEMVRRWVNSISPVPEAERAEPTSA